jgi:8-oxo-dGTP diphosphatase
MTPGGIITDGSLIVFIERVISMKYGVLRNKQGLTEEEFLSQYDAGQYERPSVTVDMLVFSVMSEMKKGSVKLPEKSLKILMVKRGDHPFMGYWALPGGFVNMDESLDTAAQRELKEETNIDNIYMEQLYTWGDVNRDPRTRIIGCSYMSLVDSSRLDVKAGDDAEDTAWFSVKCNVVDQKKFGTGKGFCVQNRVRLVLSNDKEELEAIIDIDRTFDGNIVRVSRELSESRGIAFDHGKIIEYAVESIRSRIECNTGIVFNLMPEFFTLTELRQTYEAILGKELPEAEFRTKAADMVVEHRPSKLYKYNPNWVEKHLTAQILR